MAMSVNERWKYHHLFPRVETALTKYGLYRTFVLYSVSRDKRYYPVLDQSLGHLNESCVEMTVKPCRNGSIAGGNSCEASSSPA